MGIQNRDGAMYLATGIDNTGLQKGAQEGANIIKDMKDKVSSTDVFGGMTESAKNH
jgi:hypothetical protein